MEAQQNKSFQERVQRILPTNTDSEIFKEEYNITAETFSFFEDSLKNAGFEEFSDISSGYKGLGGESLIVRREDPRKILSILAGESYEVGFPDVRYSNCVEWTPDLHGARGITNAYLEGHTSLNSVVTVVGFEKNNSQDIERLQDASANFHGLDRDLVRSFKGQINPEDVTFIALRAPAHMLDESLLTDDEMSRLDDYLEKRESHATNPVMIHRLFVKKTELTQLH
jgi:hypothetical protein